MASDCIGFQLLKDTNSFNIMAPDIHVSCNDMKKNTKTSLKYSQQWSLGWLLWDMSETVFKINAGPRTLTSTTWVGLASFRS